MGRAMTFSDELCRLLRERGMSQRELARRSHYDCGHINKLCTGVKPATPGVAAVLDDILGAGGTLMAAVNRRSVLAGAAALASAPLLGVLDAGRLEWAQRHPLRIDTAAVESLAGVLAAQRRAEDSVGAAAVMKPVLAQLGEIEDLVRHVRGPVRPALISVAQQWAQFAAYLRRDAGDGPGDRARLAQALEWAQEAGDATMTATVLVQRGSLALGAGALGSAIGLAQAAQRDRRAAAGQRADAADLEARAYAAAGDGLRAERKLAEAAELAGNLGRLPPWLYWMNPWYFECARGAAYGYLAPDPRYRDLAVSALEGGYARLPGDQPSSAWASTLLVRLAAVHARGGDPGRACEVAMRCAGIAEATGSVRLRGMLAALCAGMAERWPRDPGVVVLGEAIR
jgi:transcriptional regulator with XRE-family HTH domain